jgi:hypothetical protein
MRCLIFIGLVVSSLNSLSQTWNNLSTLAPAKRTTNDHYGTMVEVNGWNAFVTSPGDNDDELENPGGTIGSVYIYTKPSGNGVWSFVQKIKAPAGSQNFASSIAASGDYLVVGAKGSPSGGYDGAAFVYLKNTQGKWDLVQTLGASDPSPLNNFGYRVAIAGNVLIVAAPQRSPDDLSFSGAAYVFEKDMSGAWIEKQILTASDAAYGDALGYAAAVGDNIIALGAPYESVDAGPGGANSNQGAVYLFEKQSGSWVETTKITQEVRRQYGNFGAALDISGGRLAITGKVDNVGYLSVSLYEKDTDPGITFKKQFTTESASSNDPSVAIAGDRAVLSINSDGNAEVYYFEKETPGSDWRAAPSLYSPNYGKVDGSQYETFGGSVSISDRDVLIGAPTNDVMDGSGLGFNSGVAHFYRHTGKPMAFTKTFPNGLTGNFFRPALVDFDNDGDLDVFGSDYPLSKLYRKETSGYTLVRSFPSVEFNGDAAWLDVNADGWLDLIIRHEVNYELVNSLFTNKKNGTFEETTLSLGIPDNTYVGLLYFADYDNDGDQDVLVQAKVDPGASPFMKLLRNNGDYTFTDPQITLQGIVQSSQPWFDYNNDGFVDLVTIGPDCFNGVKLHQNNAGKSFTTIQTSANAMDATGRGYVNYGDMITTDFDNDGDGDIIWAGSQNCTTSPLTSGVITNSGGQFSNSNIGIRGYSLWATMIAGDFTNDGITDIVNIGNRNEPPPGMEFLVGTTTTFQKFMLYEVPRDIQSQGMDVGDVDGDGDLDFFIFAQTSFPNERPMIYENNAAQGWTHVNQTPSTPIGLRIAYSGKDNITLVWNASNDDTTPSKALTYNVLLTRNDSVIFNTWSNMNGSRQRFVIGNAGYNTFLPFQKLKAGVYKAKVQAIDNSYAGSVFSESLEFSVGVERPNNLSWADNLAPLDIEAIHDGVAGMNNDMFLVGSGIAARLALFRYSDKGTRIWTKSYNTSDAIGIAIATDNSNNVYVAGNYYNGFEVEGVQVEPAKRTSGVFLLKYSSEGVLIWVRTFASWESNVNSMVMANDAIYLGGSFLETSADVDPYDIISYDFSGLLKSKLRLKGNMFLNDLIDAQDGLYVSADTVYSNTLRAMLMRLSFDGTEVWTKNVLAEQTDYSEAVTAEIDSNGDIYVMGYSSSKFITKFSKSGDRVFTTYIDGFEYLFTPPVTGWGRRHWGITTKGRDIFVVGGFGGEIKLRDGISVNATDREVVIIKFNDIGYPQWIRNFSGEGFDYARTIFPVGDKLVIAGTFEGTELTVDNNFTLLKVGNFETGFVAVLEDGVTNICPSPYPPLVFNDSEICANEKVILSMDMTPWSHRSKWLRSGNEFSPEEILSTAANVPGEYVAIVNPGSSCPFESEVIKIDLEQNVTTNTDVTIFPLPDSKISGVTEGCTNDKAIYVTPVVEGYGYDWTVSGGSPSKGTTQSHEVTWATAGKVILKVTNIATGCVKSDTLKVSINPQPEKPVIKQIANTLSVEAATSYQWYKGDLEISAEQGGLSQSLNIVEAGEYAVKVSNSFGCMILSDKMQFIFTGLEDMFSGIRIYPIPARGELYLENGTNSEFTVSIVDISGKQQRSITTLDKFHLFDLSDLAPGVYFVQLSTNGRIGMMKFMKL